MVNIRYCTVSAICVHLMYCDALLHRDALVKRVRVVYVDQVRHGPHPALAGKAYTKQNARHVP